MRLNTNDTVKFTWDDPRQGIRTFDTALRKGKIIVEDISGINDWTITRHLLSDGETGRQLEIDHTWKEICFEIKGKIIDDTKETDSVFKAFFKTSKIVHLNVSGYDTYERDFFVDAFQVDRYGAVRDFTVSCTDTNGHIRSMQTKVFDLAHTQGQFTFPFENKVGEFFSFGYSELTSEVDIYSNSFIENEPFIFECLFGDTAEKFAISNDAGQVFRIVYPFMAQDLLRIDMINSVFRLIRGRKPVSILTSIDYAGSSIFGIRQGWQTVRVSEVSLGAASITFTEHLA